MTAYALTWRPHTDNLGHDLVALAALQHLPRVDYLIDADAPDMAPLPADADRVVTLMASHFLTAAHHWPPHPAIAPACIGIHVSEKDAWGIPFSALDGAGLAALQAVAPISVRDERTAKRLASIGVPHVLHGDITLTLQCEALPRKGLVCCDAPEEVVEALRAFRPDVQQVTHELPNPAPNFTARMDAARALLRTYAGAEMVFTRRLHCAMACLALGTPVLLLYRPEYEDVHRFAPMNTMVRCQAVDDFLQEIARHALPAPWRNPADIGAIQRDMNIAIAHALRQAENCPLPIIPTEDAARWRKQRALLALETSAKRIAQMENDRYEDLRRKFDQLDTEDRVKSGLTAILTQPEVREGLRAATMRVQLEGLSPKDQKALRSLQRQGVADTEELADRAFSLLAELGWPEAQDK